MSDENEKQPSALQKASADRRAMVPMGERGIALQNLDDLMKFAEMAVETVGQKGMTKGQAAIAIQAGLERGLGLLGGLQAAVVINNVLSWRGWAAVGFIQNSPVIVPGSFKSWVEGEGDSRTGYCTAQRKGYSEPFLRKFSVRDAKLAGLWSKGGPWTSRPDNMLEWRAIGDMARFHFGDVMGNLPIAEDVEAGGYVTPEGARELPSEPRPAPPSPIRDPILAELLPGAQAPAAAPQTIEVEATLVAEPLPAPAGSPAPGSAIKIVAAADQSLPRDEIHFINRDGSVAGKIVGLAKEHPEKPAAMQAVIDKQVDEVFAAAAPGSPAHVEAVAMVAAIVTPPGSPCPRCKAKLNQMGGCDLCGWPGEKDFRE